jgi:hypothetical protein
MTQEEDTSQETDKLSDPEDGITPPEFMGWFKDWLTNPGRKRLSYNEIINIVLTAVIAAAALGSLWVFQGQLTVMNTESTDAGNNAIIDRRHSRQQLRTMQDQAIAAQNNVAAIQQQVRQYQLGLNATISEMRKQTTFMQDEANATAQQGEISRNQASARLRFEHFNQIPSNDGGATITFDLINDGDSEATEIGEDGGDSPVASDPSKDAQLMAEGRINPSGDSLEKGASKHVEFGVSKVTQPNPAIGVYAWYAYRKYTYLDIFQRTSEACILVFEHKGRFYSKACPPDKREQQNNPN